MAYQLSQQAASFKEKSNWDSAAYYFEQSTKAWGELVKKDGFRFLAIANPGEFLFCGNVPEEMKAAALGMGLKATFAPSIAGFQRN